MPKELNKISLSIKSFFYWTVFFCVLGSVKTQASTVINVSNGNPSAPFYTFTDSTGGTIDITTYNLIKGQTYQFIDDGVSSGHPFMVGEDTVNNSSLVSGTPLNGLGTSLIVTIPNGFSGSLIYFCTAHLNTMQANLNIVDIPPLAVYNLDSTTISGFAYQGGAPPSQSYTPGFYAFTETHDPIMATPQLYMEPVVSIGPGPDGITGNLDDQYQYTNLDDGILTSYPSLFDLSGDPSFNTLNQIGGVPFGSPVSDPPHQVYELSTAQLLYLTGQSDLPFGYFYAFHDHNGTLSLEPVIPYYDPLMGAGPSYGNDGTPGTSDDPYEFSPENDSISLVSNFPSMTEVETYLVNPTIRGQVSPGMPTNAPPLAVYNLDSPTIDGFAYQGGAPPSQSYTPGFYAFTETHDPIMATPQLYMEPVVSIGPGPDGITGNLDDQYQYTNLDDGILTSYPSLFDLSGDPSFNTLNQIGGVPFGSPVSSGYQTPDSGYQSPGTGYQTPDNGYQTPDNGYQSPDGGYTDPNPSGYADSPGFLLDTNPIDPNPSGYADSPGFLLDTDHNVLPFDFTIFKTIDLNNPSELAELAKNHSKIFFQYYTGYQTGIPFDQVMYPENSFFDQGMEESNGMPFDLTAPSEFQNIIWVLSIENDNPDETNFIVDRNGNVYIGHFGDYWRDAHQVNVDIDPDWFEVEYSASEIGVESLYANHPEILGEPTYPPTSIIPPFDFTVIDQINLSDPKELAELAKDYDNIFFQSYLPSGFDPFNNPQEYDPNFYPIAGDPLFYEPFTEFDQDAVPYDYPTDQPELIWIISIENEKDSEIPNLIVDMDGSVFAGHFEAFWRDAHNVNSIDDPNWHETTFSNDTLGIENLYNQHPQILGEPTYPPSPTIPPFDFTVIDQINLSDPMELAELAKGYDNIFFQFYLPTGFDPFSDPQEYDPNFYPIAGDPFFYKSIAEYQAELVWNLSIENEENSEIPNLIVDMDGSVFAGHFEAFWRDAHNVIIIDALDWRETAYSTDTLGIDKLYFENPEIAGDNKKYLDKENVLLIPQQPIVQAESAEIIEDDIFILSAEILATGDSPIFELGFIVSESMNFINETRLIAERTDEPFFSVILDNLEPNRSYFYRAFATNQSGESFSSIKKFRTQNFQSWDENNFDLEAGWKSSDWFGSYLPFDNDWIYHQEIGWSYVIEDGSKGVWLWTEEFGWQWTEDGVWPYLYRFESSTWLYFLKNFNGQPIYYDYSESRYLAPPPAP